MFAGLVAFTVIHLVLPLAMLVVASVQRSILQPGLDGFTGDHWKLVASADTLRAVANTIVVGVAAALVGMALVGLTSYVVMRTTLRGRGLLEVLTWVPYMVPSFVLGVGVLWAVLRGNPLPWVLYGTHAALVLALVIRLIPLGSRLMNGTMVQLAKELEEAARMSGATWTRTFRRIVLPLLGPAIAIGVLMFIVIAVRDLSTVILLYGPGSTVLSVLFYAQWRSGTFEDASAIGLVMTALGLAAAGGIVLVQRLARGPTAAVVS